MLDKYWHGSAKRISPEAPVPIVPVDLQESRGGGAANVALNISALSANQVFLQGIVGKDKEAQILQEKLETKGVKTAFCYDEKSPTITKLRIMSHNQQLLRLDFEEKFCNFDQKEFLQTYKNILQQVDLVIISDYAKGSLVQVADFIQLAKQANKMVLVDPKGEDWQKYANANILTPNMREFELIVGEVKSEADLEAKARKLCADLNLDSLLITRSEKGMSLVSAIQVLHLGTKSREVFDVTGAGDTVIAVLGLALASGHKIKEAITLANLAASIVVAKPGTATLSVAELYTALHKEKYNEYGVIDLQNLLNRLESTRLKNSELETSKKEKIVFTNGCFDILHAGHVAYLEEAKALGDRLIVAVNSDASVSRLKGEDRPINSLEKRMKVLAGLESVDWVISFDEDTPKEVIEKILPDILVKGGDYKTEQLAGAQEVLAAGGEVKILQFMDGVSTTNIINRILEK